MHSLRDQEAPRTRATWQIRRPVRRHSLGDQICLAARTSLGCTLNLIALIAWTASAQATVSAGTYKEAFYGNHGASLWVEGTDDHKAEKIYLNHALTFDSNPPGQWGASISFVGSAESQVKGPSAYVQLTGTGSSGDIGAHASGDSSGEVNVRYAVAAVKDSSSWGTELIPVIIEGYVSAQVDISGPGKGSAGGAVAIFEPGTVKPSVFIADAVANTYFTPVGPSFDSDEQYFTYHSDLVITGGFGAASAPLIIDLQAGVDITPVVRTVPVFPGTGFTVDAGSVTGFGFADPLVYIDPTWEFAGDYHLDISPGVIPYSPSPVPEPGSFSLLGLGLAGVWLVRRRRTGGRRNHPQAGNAAKA